MAIILANDGIDASAKAALEAMGHTVDTNKYEGDALLARLPEVDCIVIRSATKMRGPQIAAGATGSLKLIIRAGVGIDNIDVEDALAHKIAVRNTPEASSNAVAEVAFAHMLALCHRLYASNVTMRQGKWLKKEYEGTELLGKTLGLIGFGRIARNLAEKAVAFGMDVIYTRRTDAPEYGYRQTSLDEVIETADFISLHTPSMGKPVLGRAEFARMKDGVYIVNTARGDLIDDDALLEALDSGKVAGAALDVFRAEPLTDERLWSHPKISLTPHLGAATKEAQARIGDVIVDIIKEVL